MNSADARDQFEAAVWRALGLGPRWSKAVDSILAAADAYAEATADARISRMAEDQALGPARLAEATAEAFERKEH